MGSLAACAKRQRWLRHRCLRQLFQPASRTDLSATGLTCVRSKRLYICFTHRRRLLSLRLLACEALFCSLCGLCFWAPCDSTTCTVYSGCVLPCTLPTLLLPTRPRCALGSALYLLPRRTCVPRDLSSTATSYSQQHYFFMRCPGRGLREMLSAETVRCFLAPRAAR